MFTAVTIIGILFAIVIHEFAHGYVMYRYGVEIAEAGIGVGKGIIPHFYVRWRNIPIKISVLLIGGYVMPSEQGNQQIKALDYRKQSDIYGAGVYSNVIFCLLMGNLAFLIRPNVIFLGSYLMYFDFIIIPLLLFRRTFCRYFVPVVGSVLLGYILYLMFVNGPTSAVGGPATIVKMSVVEAVADWRISLSDAFSRIATISLAIGLFNMIPLIPLDGGRIVLSWINAMKKERMANAFSAVGVFMFFALILLAITSDVLSFT